MEPTPQEIRAACEQACRYRQRLAIDTGACSARNVHEVVAWVEAPPKREADGRWQVGWVSDATIGGLLAVWWYPASGVVGIDDPEAEPEPAPYVAPPFARRGVEYGWATSPGYIYLFEGQEYDSRAAEAAINRQGNLDGWTWRRADPAS